MSGDVISIDVLGYGSTPSATLRYRDDVDSSVVHPAIKNDNNSTLLSISVKKVTCLSRYHDDRVFPSRHHPGVMLRNTSQ